MSITIIITSVFKISRRSSHPTATFLFATPIFVTSVDKFPKLNTLLYYTSCLQLLLPKLQLLRQNLVKTLITVIDGCMKHNFNNFLL